MSRFGVLASSVTGVDTVGPVGFKELGRGSRVHIQFATMNSDPFSVRALGTLDYDFTANIGSNWFDMSRGLMTNQTEEDELGMFKESGHFQHKKKKKGALSISSEGVYAFDSDFIPAALIFLVDSVTAGDNLKIILGV